MPNTVFLRLDGPLQAWGERGRWSVRDTAPEPTKSGVIGLIGCAMGMADDAGLRALSERTRFGVRCDAPGVLLTDYHTIGGGYAAPFLLDATGKPKATAGRAHVEISHRDYLCSASFLAALQAADATLIAEIAAALQRPVWTIFLGRKSCPPAHPVFAGVGEYPSLPEALARGSWPDHLGARPPRVRAVVETSPEHGVRRRDHLVARSVRRYGARYSAELLVEFAQEAT